MLLPVLGAALVLLQSGISHKPSGGLQTVFGNSFTMGVALAPFHLRNEAETALVLREFGSITPENAMKMGPIHPEENRYNWKDADLLADFARSNKLKMRGHALCWHKQAPAWIFVDNKGKEVSKEVLLQRLKDHIFAVAGRYKDIVYAWDVVNEAVSDTPGEWLRPSPWLRICGESYIEMAFRWAHEADPNAQLFYNDYNETDPVKREKILRLISSLKGKGVPVHGIGLQGHWAMDEPRKGQLDSTLRDFAATGLRLQITELDISVYPKEHEARAWKASDADTAYTAEKQARQTAQYQQCFALFRKYDPALDAITFWNLSDRYSWLDNFPVRGRKDYPLLFNAALQPKPAYEAVVEDYRQNR